MFSLLVDLTSADGGFCCDSVQAFRQAVKQKCQFLLSARPTAVNLANAFTELIAFLHTDERHDGDGAETAAELNRLKMGYCTLFGLLSIRPNQTKIPSYFGPRPGLTLEICSPFPILSLPRLKQFVLDWQSRESAENVALLKNAVEAVLSCSAKKGGQNDDKKKLVVMTICNTGQLATSSLGTALGECGNGRVRGKMDLRKGRKKIMVTAF